MLHPRSTFWITGGIFAATYTGLAIGRIPGLRADRAAIAYVGAAGMLVTGVLTLSQAVAPDSIDYETIFLLLGMMVVVGALRVSGAIDRLAHGVLGRVHSRALLAAVVGLSGVLSMFLVNDVVCLALTPLVLHLAKRLRFDPVPQLIGLATAANVGSTGTITGNPQNMIIGAASKIGYGPFAVHLLPVAAVGLVVTFGVVAVVYRKALSTPTGAGDPPDHGRPPRFFPSQIRLQIKSGLVAAITVGLFFTGLPTAVVATAAAAVLLLSRIKPRRFYREIDFTLLLMFAGLFVVVHAFQMHVVSLWHVERWHWLLARPVDLLSVASAGLSNLVSNVPAVLLLEPVIHAMPPGSQPRAWLALAMSSTLAGNLTVLGSIANLIVVERARHDGVRVSFWEYCRAGVPVTILTIMIGIAWLMWGPGANQG